mmetsp:Transcript_50022/g.119019  ORF Transcript_50022/g.119019 Transcript_50022/m.119019 type:complete len:84 (+) Transcript_50022:2427-2678(+)
MPRSRSCQNRVEKSEIKDDARQTSSTQPASPEVEFETAASDDQKGLNMAVCLLPLAAMHEQSGVTDVELQLRASRATRLACVG